MAGEGADALWAMLRSSVALEGDRQPGAWVSGPSPTGLRSSVAPEGDRQPRPGHADADQLPVAILGRPRGRPPGTGRAAPRSRPGRCDPRSPRRTTATWTPHRGICAAGVVAILGHPGGRPPPLTAALSPACTRGCDPRSPQRATASNTYQASLVVLGPLRSSAAPKGDRQRRRRSPRRPRPSCCDPRPPRRVTAKRMVWANITRMSALRSSVAPEDDRQVDEALGDQVRRLVAILGRSGGRPPLSCACGALRRWCGCDPRSPRRANASLPFCLGTFTATSLHPRSPQRATASLDADGELEVVVEIAILGRPGGRLPRCFIPEHCIDRRIFYRCRFHYRAGSIPRCGW